MFWKKFKDKFFSEKLAAVFLIFLLLFVFNPIPAKAQLVATNPILDAASLKGTFTTIWDGIKKGIGKAAAIGLTKALDYFGKKLAQTSAEWIASGDYTKGPAFITDAGNYFTDAAKGAAGEFIADLGDMAFLKKYGINLCVPPDPNYQIKLKLSMANEQAPTPRCNFDQIIQGYKKLGTPEGWQKVGVGFEPGQNGLSLARDASLAMKAFSGNTKISAAAKEELKIKYEGLVTPPKEPVAQIAKTPKELAEEEVKRQAAAVAAAKAEEAKSAKQKLEEGSLDALANMGNMFLNTLSDKLQEKLLKVGMYSLSKLWKTIDCKKNSCDADGGLANKEAQFVSGRAAAEAYFADFTTPQFSELENFPYLAELAASCSDSKTVYCGALDSNLQTALTQFDAGKVLTVKEALESGALNGGWYLSGPNQPCLSQSYCYNNLVKLRIFRILPVGWEMAAKISDGKATLQEVIDNFYNLKSLSGLNNPYYHLIDPNWVLKAPKAKCGAEAYSSMFLVEPKPEDNISGERSKYCADIQNCVNEDPKTGQCDSWGYCLSEKNVWKLGADSCDAQFNSCTGYTNSKGASATYLANTISPGICATDNVGCRAYSTNSDYGSTGPWQWQTTAGNLQYFNNKIEKCEAGNEGCSKFLRAGDGLNNQPLNLKKAPSYYNCYGELLPSSSFASTTLHWALNKSDLYKIDSGQNAAQKQECGRFAPVCSYEEQGCELYTPDSGNPSVPGVLTANDQCPSDCVGYETYLEQPIGQFTSATAPTYYFIPATAKSCQADYAGCDEFVNVEAQAAGGETKSYFSEIRTCLKQGGETYYTWEGSDTTGYQLKSYNLEKISPPNLPYGSSGSIIYDSGNAPPTYNIKGRGENGATVESAAKVEEYKAACNSEKYKNRATDQTFNPDCREFYDKDGNKSYRLYSKTITISNQCQTFRKTVSDSASCLATNGAWDSVKNFCTYLTIPNEGKSCPAEASGCRAYKGNAGNNFTTIYQQNFETGTVGQDAKALGWQKGRISSESTMVGGKSLKSEEALKNNYYVDLVSYSKTTSTAYVLSFWAKGKSNTLTVELCGSKNGNGLLGACSTPKISQTVQLNNNWSTYNVGPFTTTWGAEASTTLRIISDDLFFLDNMTAKSMVDNIYALKDSWQTPYSCDNVLGDPIGESGGGNFNAPLRLVPQAQLGCSTYKNRQGLDANVKSFTNLCREEAVGCEKLTDTLNTETSATTLSNALCGIYDKAGLVLIPCADPNSGSICYLSPSAVQNKSSQPIACKDKNSKTKCSIAPGQKFCRFSVSGLANNSMSVLNSILNPTLPDSTHISLAGIISVNPTVRDNRGVEYTLALSTDSESIFTPSDRDVYLVNDNKFQCADSNLGCSALGVVTYDKDGNATSTAGTYLKNKPDDYSKILCESAAEGCEQFTTSKGGSSYFKDPTIFGNKVCEWKNPIDDTHPNGGWVKKGTTESCSGLNYGIRRTNDVGYEGAVGLCPSDQDGCSEFIDPFGAATVENPLGQPYYVINNDKIDRSSCQGQASLEKGCVLFNETSKATLSWSASSTYDASLKKDYEKVNPENCNKYSSIAGNPNYNAVYNCSKSPNNSNAILKVQRDRVCGRWLAYSSSMQMPKDGVDKEIGTQLKECVKASGSSDNTDNNNNLLGKCDGWAESSQIFPNPSNQLTNDIYKNRLVSFKDQDLSGYSIPNAYQISNLSVNNIDDKIGLATTDNKAVFENSSGVIPQTCRGFAAGDAPDGANGQKETNPSNPLDPNKFCSFTKAVFSGGDKQPQTKYFPYSEFISVDGVCDGGYFENNTLKKGTSCSNDTDCGDDRPKVQGSADKGISFASTCIKNKKVVRSAGWQGYCLFEDLDTKACLQWYPLTIPSNTTNLYELNMTAGYFPPEGSGKYWCVQAKGNSNRVSNYNNNQISSASYALVTSKDDGILPQLNRLFPNMSNWASEKTVQLTDAEAKINLSEIAAIGLKIIDATDVPKGKELLIFPEQTLSGIKTSDDSFYWSGPLKFLPNGSLSLDLVWAGVVQGNRSYFNSSDYDFLDRNLCTRVNSGGQNNFIGFRANFDKDTGKLTNIDTKMCDNDETGWAQVDLVFYLKEVCTDIRQVVQNDPTDPIFGAAVKASPLGFLSKPRTDRIWQYSKYTVGGDKGGTPPVNLDLQYNQLNPPFGSFSQTKDPEIESLGTVLKSLKTLSEKKTAWRKSGYWPIWFSDGGATPLNCAGENGGDCGGVALCEDGPKKGTVCSPTLALGENGCEENFPDGKCVGVPNYVYTGKIRGIDFTTDQKCEQNAPAKTSLRLGACGETDLNGDGVCLDDFNKKIIPEIKCNKVESKKANCTAYTSRDDQINCTIGPEIKKCDKSGLPYKEGDVCSADGECSGVQPYACTSQNNIRGLCVGGSNHNKYCAGNSDCPSRTYTETQGNKEVVENGVCVGAALDDGKTIPVGGNNYRNYPNRSYCRLGELFAQVFNTWSWDNTNSKNQVAAGVSTEDQSPGSYNQPGYDYGCLTDFTDPTTKIVYPANPAAVFTPHPPQISSFTINKSSSGPVPLKGEQVEVTLEFFAYADNDQMPLTRISVDWGDGTTDAPDVYSVKGWYKNRKGKCEVKGWKVCDFGKDLNRPCNDEKDCDSTNQKVCSNPLGIDNRLHFGNSPSACEEKPFVFKHIYECKAGAPGKTCSFIPKVQVLDNWGWCNSGIGGGLWNDEVDAKGKIIEEESRACFTGQSNSQNPWTSFGGSINITP